MAILCALSLSSFVQKYIYTKLCLIVCSILGSPTLMMCGYEIAFLTSSCNVDGGVESISVVVDKYLNWFETAANRIESLKEVSRSVLWTLLNHVTVHLPGLIWINDCWSTHKIAVRDSSSKLATETVELNDSNSGLKINPNCKRRKMKTTNLNIELGAA